MIDVRVRMPCTVEFELGEEPMEVVQAMAVEWSREFLQKFQGRDWEGRERYGVRSIGFEAGLARLEVIPG